MAYENYGEEGPRPRNDAYTGLLALSFFAMLIACLLLLVDWYGYDSTESPAKKILKSLPPVKPGVAAAPGPAAPAPKVDVQPKVVPPPAQPKDEMKGKEAKPADGKMDAKDGKDDKKMAAKDEKKADNK